MDAGFNGWQLRSIIMPNVFISAMKRNKITIAAQQNVNLHFKIFV